MAGDLKLKYGTRVDFTVTNLHSLASSQSWIAGWSSASTANTSALNLDYMYGGTFTTHASNRQAGTINVYCIASLNDTPLWPAVSSGTIGTEGALAFADIYRRSALVRVLASIEVDNTASAIYTFPQVGIAWLFGRCPTHHAIFVALNTSTTTTAGLASSGSALYHVPVMAQYT